MSLRQRRIFRATLAARWRAAQRVALAVLACGVVAAGLAGAVAVGPRVAGVVASLHPAHPAAPAPTAVLRAPSREAAVVSGDTLLVDGQVVRLQGIEAPARGESCRAAADCGAASAASLAGLVGSSTLECRLAGEDGMGRPYGDCVAGGADLGEAQVAAGWARARAGTGTLAAVQATARARRVGVWSGS